MTMDSIIADCASKMSNINLQPADYGDHVLPATGRSYYGLCRYKDMTKDVFEIECQPDLDEHMATSTLFHELAHTLPGCFNHDKGFLAACKMTDEAYGTNNELKRMHRHCSQYFEMTYHLVIRFTGAVGDKYGVALEDGTIPKPVYEIVAVLPDGRREVEEAATGRRFAADLVEIRGLRPRSRRAPDSTWSQLDELLRLNAMDVSSKRRLFTDGLEIPIPVRPGVGDMTYIVNEDQSQIGLGFEAVGVGRGGFTEVCEPITKQVFVAGAFDISELSYRRRYLAYEAVMRSGIGKNPDPWMRCGGLSRKHSLSSLAALVESVWNVNDLVRDGATRSRVGRSLNTLDTRILDAADKSKRDLEDTLLFACQAFTGFADHRGITTSAEAMRVISERV